MLARIRWFAMLATSMVLGGCVAQLPPCYDPGTQFSKSCYYKLTIKDMDSNGLVTGTVADEVVQQNRTRWFWQNESLPYPMGPDFEEYDKAVYTFGAPGLPSDAKGKTFEFCSVPNTRELKLIPPQNQMHSSGERCSQSQTPAQKM